MRRPNLDVQTVKDTISSPQKLIVALNGLASLFIFAVVITAIAAAAQMPTSGLGAAVGFVAIANMLLLLGLNVGAFYVLRKRPTATMVTYMTGVIHLLTWNMLMNAILFRGMDSEFNHASFRAYIAFSILLFLTYGAMSIVLVRNRDVIVDQTGGASQQSHPDDTFEPPPAVADASGSSYEAPASTV